MKKLITTALSLSALTVLAHGPNDGHKHENLPVSQQVQTGEILGHGSLKYKVHKDWGKLEKADVIKLKILRKGNIIDLARPINEL